MEAVSITGLSANVGSPTLEEKSIMDDRPPLSKEEIDTLRHREITSKGVSAILLLILKWFKASRVYLLPFHQPQADQQMCSSFTTLASFC
jgi:hypothetical protein